MRSIHYFILFNLLIPPFSSAHADIFRRNGELIPGTEGIEPGPGVRLDQHELAFADFDEQDLTGSSFEGAFLERASFRSASLMSANFNAATLTNASFRRSTLTDATFHRANLTYADLRWSELTNAKFDDAIIRNARFHLADGFTAEQLAATASYKAKDLSGTSFGQTDFSEMNFRGYNLTNAYFDGSTLADATFDGANLTDAELVRSVLTDANFQGVNLTNAKLNESALTNVNFQGANLTNANFDSSALTDASFQDANLTNAELNESFLTNATFNDAIIRNASFRGGGFASEQLAATASYKEKDLSDIYFGQMDFSELNFQGYNLANAMFSGGSLVGADFRQANLYYARVYSDITNAKFNDAIVKGADFRTLSPQQLYSTSNYKEKDLTQIRLTLHDDQLWDLSGQNLSGSTIGGDGMKMAKVEGAIVKGATLDLTAAQLYSTVSYQSKDLRGIRFGNPDGGGGNISGWDFTGQNLTDARLSTFFHSGTEISNADFSGADLTHAHFYKATLTDANFSDAVITGAYFGSSNFTANQLYLTASHRQKDLRKVSFSGLDLSGWDFSGQDLSNADLSNADLTGANLDNTNLFGADLFNAIGFAASGSTNIRNVIRAVSDEGETLFGATSAIDGLELQKGEHLSFFATRHSPILVNDRLELAEESILEIDVSCSIGCHYANLELQEGMQVTLGGTLRIVPDPLTVPDWAPKPNSLYLPQFIRLQIFHFEDVTFSNTFSSFELPIGKWDVSQLTFDGGIYLVERYRGDGDVNVDGQLDVDDIDQLSKATRHGRDKSYDLNSDQLVDQEDRVFWIREFKNTWFGDANLDGEFNTSDLVQVFQAGHYEDDVAMNSGWAEGDWNGDGDFNTSDLVFAFQDGGYERGPRAANLIAVPEPSSLLLVGWGLVGLRFNRRRQRQLAM